MGNNTQSRSYSELEPVEIFSYRCLRMTRYVDVPRVLEAEAIQILKDGFEGVKIPNRLWRDNWFFVDKPTVQNSPLVQTMAIFSWDSSARQVNNFAVSSNFRRQGIGSTLLQAIHHHKGEFSVNVETQNRGALEFYFRNGFMIQHGEVSVDDIVTLRSPSVDNYEKIYLGGETP